MNPNQNPPSEREWTIEEQEEFFSSDDAITGLPWYLMPGRTGICVTAIKPLLQGWLMSYYCPLCRETWFLLSPWACKPKDGDYFKLTEMCANPDFAMKHNLQFCFKIGPLPLELGHSRIKSAVGRIEYQVHNPLPPQDVPSVVEFTREMSPEEAKRRWPNTPIPGEKNGD